MEWRSARAASFVLATGLGLVSSTTAGAREHSGELDPEGDAVYEGYAYGVYEIETSGEKLSVSMNASSLDGYLILRSPEETFRTDDDSGEGRNARIEVSEPGRGTWIAIVTSYSSARGPYSVVVKGASHVARVDPEDVDAELVRAAFFARGVVNQEQKLARKIQMLKEQLSLPSFREQLINDLRRVVIPEGSTARESYRELEARERGLEVALDEVDSFEASQDLVRGLLEDELSSTRSRLSRMSDAIEARVEEGEASAIAVDALRELDESALELHQLEERLLDPEGGEGLDVRDAQLEIVRLRATINELSEGIAPRLLESGLIEAPLRQ